MRTGKKLTSWVLFFVMLFSVAVFPVMADEPAGNGSAPMESFSDNDLNQNGIPDDEEELGPEGIEDNSDKDHDALIKDFEFEDEEVVIDDGIQSEIYLDNSEFLANLGLYRFSEKYYRDTVTRGEFAAMIMDLLGGQEFAHHIAGAAVRHAHAVEIVLAADDLHPRTARVRAQPLAG